jgi:hypothetical protein
VSKLEEIQPNAALRGILPGLLVTALCERKKRAAEASSYNALVQSWPEIARLARHSPAMVRREEPQLFEEEP